MDICLFLFCLRPSWFNYSTVTPNCAQFYVKAGNIKMYFLHRTRVRICCLYIFQTYHTPCAPHAIDKTMHDLSQTKIVNRSNDKQQTLLYISLLMTLSNTAEKYSCNYLRHIYIKIYVINVHTNNHSLFLRNKTVSWCAWYKYFFVNFDVIQEKLLEHIINYMEPIY